VGEPDRSPRRIGGTLRCAAERAGPEARLDAECLLAHVLEVPRASLLAHPERGIAPPALARFEALLARRRLGEPLAYLVGSKEFWSLELEVAPATLVPRPETEHLVEQALDALAPLVRPLVADLGTGSGAVAIAIARERPDARVVASDVSGAAIVIAARNAVRHRVANVRFCRASWLAAVRPGRLAVVVANPPYVEAADPALDAPPLVFEPRLALAAGRDGLDAIRVIVAQAARALAPGGALLLEHGAGHGAAVRTLLAGAGFAEVASACDYAGHERIARAVRA